MRNRISVQSWLSVPPAPAWMVTTAGPLSYSPVNSASSCSRPTSPDRRSTDRSSSSRHSGSSSGQLEHAVQLGHLGLERAHRLQLALDARPLGGDLRAPSAGRPRSPAPPSARSSSASARLLRGRVEVVARPREAAADLLDRALQLLGRPRPLRLRGHGATPRGSACTSCRCRTSTDRCGSGSSPGRRGAARPPGRDPRTASRRRRCSRAAASSSRPAASACS